MGILGLTTYMERYYSSEWREIQIKGHLVVDGYSLCHTLYAQFHVDWCHGGQYWSFRQHLTEFINCLKKSSIYPVVVFDGIDYKREKQEIIWKRREEWVRSIKDFLISGNRVNRVLPQMSVEVFRETLEELQIPLYVVDGEADWDAVAIANFYKCPVVANDSDYYMYNIEGGYIPIDKLYWNNEPVTGKIYFLKDFNASVGFSCPEFHLMIPALLGNDFLSCLLCSVLRVDIGQQRGSNKADQIHQMIRYFTKFRSLEDFYTHLSLLDNGDHLALSIKENFEKAKEMYTVRENLSEEKLMMTTELVTSNGTCLPIWILSQYRKGFLVSGLMESLVIGQCFLRIVVDNPHKKSAQLCSRKIRQSVYAILLPYMKSPEVNEIMRQDASLHIEPVPILLDIPNLPTVDKIQELSLSDRLQTLCTVMECDPAILEGFENKWKLVLLATCYWAKHTSPQEHLIKVLILSFILCSRDKDPSTFLPRRIREDHTSYWLDSLHSFSTWQCVYFDAMTLNNILFNPLRFVTPALLFDGQLVMYYACKKDMSRIIEQEASGSSLYSKFLDAVMSFLPRSKKGRKETPTATHGESKASKKKQAAVGPTTTNRFAMLALEDDDDSNDDSNDNN